MSRRALKNESAKTMASTVQLSFRLPEPMVRRLDACTTDVRARGLDFTRADVVRLLLHFALDETGHDTDRLLGIKARRAKRR